MNTESLIDACKYVAVAYLLLVAATAVLGVHRPLLAYPLRVGYSALRLVLATVTFGRVRMVPTGKKLKRRGARRLRNWRFEVHEWRELRAEARGDSPAATAAGSGWTTAVDADPSAASSPAPQLVEESDGGAPPVYETTGAAPATYDTPAAPQARVAPARATVEHEEVPLPDFSAPATPPAAPAHSLLDDEDDEEMPLPPFFED
jgi:hypothetical protein